MLEKLWGNIKTKARRIDLLSCTPKASKDQEFKKSNYYLVYDNSRSINMKKLET